ncbi:SAV_2336 N-terminal domain-related protein [Streptomyces sp. DSM 118878]
MAIDRLRDALDALGPPVTPLELAEMLWLAEHLPAGDGAGAATAGGRGRGDRPTGPGAATGAGAPKRAEGAGTPAGDRPPDEAVRAEAEEGATPRRGARRGTLHVPRGAPQPGSDADDVLVPAPQALHHELAIQRALRPLKRRVPDPRRRTLDERATAERAARTSGPRAWAPVMVPATDRLLSLALVADTGPSMTVWRPLVRELREAMQRTGAFRDVRVWRLTDLGPRVGVRSSPGGPAMDPAALVDPTGRQVTLVLSDCSGPHWWGGRAARALHLWASRGPTAILQPLPERLWRRTAAPAVPGRAIGCRPGAPNTVLRFVPHDGRARLPAPDAVPVPVLEIAPDWLADWAGLVTASGDHHRDTAVTYVGAAPPRRDRPFADEADVPITERVLRFQEAASPTAADLAAHVALSVPALPVMRLIQQRVTPGSRPSDLAEVLLSGLLQPLDTERGLYDFVPGARGALLETLPRPESLAVAELLSGLGAEIEGRTGSATRAFRAVARVTEGTGAHGLGPAGQPFALVSEEALELLRGRAMRVAQRPAGPSGEAGSFGAAGPRAPVPPEAVSAEPGLVQFDQPHVVDAPPTLNNVPRPQFFVGREHELRRLDHTLLSSFTPAEPPGTMVVHGEAGMGKTTLAAEWAAGVAVGDVHSPVWWVAAYSPASIVKSLSDLTRALQPSVPDFLAAEGRWEWALQWLSVHQGWVLVFDDVREPADVRVLLSRLGRGGSVLITSREAKGWDGIATPMKLRVPELPEAVDMLNRRAGRAQRGADALCMQLGRLPLAVARAATYIADTGADIAQYRAHLVRQQEAEEDHTGASGPDDSIAQRLRAAAASPGAGWLILVLAWFGRQPVPRDLLATAGPRETGVPHTSEHLSYLAACDLLRVDGDTVILKDGVAAVARTPDDSPSVRALDDIDEARHTAARCLGRALPAATAGPGDWPRWRELLPHVDALFEHAPATRDDQHVVDLLDRTAQFLLGQGEVLKSVAFLRRAVSGLERLHGAQAPETLAAAARLAEAYLADGKPDLAIATYTSTLEPASTTGPSAAGPGYVERRVGLAGAYQAAGDVVRAVREMEDVCRLLDHGPGVDRPRTLWARRRLAGAYQAAGDWDRAIRTYEQTLAAHQRVHGHDSPHTLALRGDLAGAYQAAGDPARAIDELERMAAGCRRALGADHPLTLAALSGLAGVHESQGSLDQAIGLHEDALGLSIRALGTAHPETTRLRERLAHACVANGSPKRAVPLGEEVLTMKGETLGQAHPETLRAAASLADMYRRAGARDKALVLYERTLTERLRVLGPSHAETRRSYDELTRTLCEAGRPRRAIPLIEQTLDERVSTLGDAHPESVRTRGTLADAYRQAGQPAEAAVLHHATLADLKRSLGEDHIRTYRARAELAHALAAADDMDGAIRQLRRAIHGLARELGDDAAETAAARTELARWQEHRS